VFEEGGEVRGWARDLFRTWTLKESCQKLVVLAVGGIQSCREERVNTSQRVDGDDMGHFRKV